MYLKIPVKKNRIFEYWFLFLNPILHLKEDTELVLLATLVSLHYSYRHYDKKILDSLLLSEGTLEAVRKRLDMSPRKFANTLQGLKDKQMIIDEELNPKVLQYPKDGNFKLTFVFVDAEVL